MDTNLQYSTTYYYQVWAYNASVNSPLSAIATFTTPSAPNTNNLTLSIVSPTAGEQWSNSVFTVSGQASDNVAVADVYYSLNGSGWTNASTGNGWTNWTANVTLIAGTNTIAAYAVDTSGNVSTTQSVSFVYVLTAPLTVLINGNGTVSPDYNGALLQIGQSYSMTASASAGYAFTGWTGSMTSSGATLGFTMASNLTFTANFKNITPPTVSIVSPTAGEQWSNSVFTVSGQASDNVGVADVYYSLNGSGWTSA
ncbi:MAG: Ig-like domain-containing protein, partial [Verrucomicrobiota bacterium]